MLEDPKRQVSLFVLCVAFFAAVSSQWACVAVNSDTLNNPAGDIERCCVSANPPLTLREGSVSPRDGSHYKKSNQSGLMKLISSGLFCAQSLLLLLLLLLFLFFLIHPQHTCTHVYASSFSSSSSIPSVSPLHTLLSPSLPSPRQVFLSTFCFAVTFRLRA